MSRGQQVSEGYEQFIAEGAASLAASMAEREALSAPDQQQGQANYPPPGNTPNLNRDPRGAGPSPQPAPGSRVVATPYDNSQSSRP